MKSFARLFFLIAVAVTMTCGYAAADSPGKHPAYMHALTDLRHARAFLYYKPNKPASAEEQVAINEIDAAMHELTEAALDDAKPVNDHPASDARYDRTDRLHRVQELLDQARTDVKEHESNRWSKAYRDSALKHIELARKAIKKAIDIDVHE
jgi:acyl-CoA reductase-like NAD-dependent aldehyde dehydrogenase